MFDRTILILLFERYSTERMLSKVIWSSNGEHVGIKVSYAEKDITELTEDEAMMEIL